MINKAIYSHWSCNGSIKSAVTNWMKPKYCLYSLVLSAMKSIGQFERVDLYTDSLSYDTIKELKIPFTNLTKDLDSLSRYPKTLWGLPKLKAYALQNEPFIHIDTDVFIERKLSNTFLSSPIGCQDADTGDRFTIYTQLMKTLKDNGGWVPNDDFYDLPNSHNLGIISVNDMEFNKELVDLGFEFVDKNRNLMSIHHHHLWSMLLEQYVFSYVAHKRNLTPLMVKDIRIESKKYTHLCGDKQSQDAMDMLEINIEKLYPEQYEIINKIVL